jgi:E3 ubiquitin-protein ligase SHPRH
LKLKRDKDKAKVDLATRIKDKVETIYILEKHEIPTQRLKLISDKTVSFNEFRKKNGQFLYLENLKISDYSKRGGGENPEPCPICQKSLGTQWSVLQCGHCFCVDCIRILIEEYSTGGNISRSVKCAICRNLTHHAEISYVNTK